MGSEALARLTSRRLPTLGMLANPDFYEGVRAAVIDKDRNPKWSVGLSDVTPALLSRFDGKDHLSLF